MTFGILLDLENPIWKGSFQRKYISFHCSLSAVFDVNM